MDSVIKFFTETLDGIPYIITVIIAVILILACIGYLAERSIFLKKEKDKYAKVENNEQSSPSAPVTTPVSEPVAVTPSNVIEPSQEPVSEVALVPDNIATPVAEPTTIVENNTVTEPVIQEPLPAPSTLESVLPPVQEAIPEMPVVDPTLEQTTVLDPSVILNTKETTPEVPETPVATPVEAAIQVPETPVPTVSAETKEEKQAEQVPTENAQPVPVVVPIVTQNDTVPQQETNS